MMRFAAITLKIPDNEAYSALRALQRLGVDVERVQRSALYPEYGVPEGAFNPNKHVMTMLESATPSAGEVWIEELDAPSSGRRYIVWRLWDASNAPLSSQVLIQASTRLLCNPAIEKALIAS